MFASLFSLTGLITVAGAVLLGYGTLRKSRRSALMTLAGFVVIVISLPMHFSAAGGFFSGSASLFFSAAIGLGLLGLIIARGDGSEKGQRQFLVLAVASLIAALALRTFGFAIGERAAQPAASDQLQEIDISEETSTVASDLSIISGTAEDEQSILVELGPDDTIEEIMPLIEEYGGSAERAFPTVSLDADENLSQVYIISGIKKDLLLKFIDFLKKRIEDVDNVELNETIELDDPVSTDTNFSVADGSLLTNDPLALQQWSMQVARIDAAHNILKDLTPVRKAIVAILDTGVDAGHEDIVTSFLAGSPATSDSHGHGTHCAGIAGASTNNGKGMASLNWNGDFVEISSYAALGSTGMGTVETMAQAIIDATTDGADVISMSLGEFSLFPIKVVTDAVAFAQKRGVIVVAAAGNSNQDAKMHIPSNIAGVIAVSAVDENNQKASFSNTNTSLKRPIAAPGVNIMSLEPNGKYGKKSGTSMATPLVAGLIGVMRAINPELTGEQIYKILEGTGKGGIDAKRVGNTIQADAAIRVAAGNIVVRS